MGFQFRLEKALNVKEQEKQLSELEYSSALDHFEKVALQLYQSLKEKEQLEADYEQLLKKGVHVDVLQRYERYLRPLKSRIKRQQMLVSEAKLAMESKQRAIVTKTVEVKKYAMLKEKRYKDYIASKAKEETKQMDELTVMKLGGRYGR